MRKISFLLALLLLLPTLSGCVLESLFCEHDYDITASILPTCTEEGYEERVCQKCGKNEKETFSPSHAFSEWVTQKEATVEEGGLRKRSCAVCGEIEEESTPSLSYIDLDALLFSFNASKTYEVSSVEEMIKIFNAAVLKRSVKARFETLFDYRDLGELLEILANGCTIPFSPAIEAEARGKSLTLTLSYDINPTASTQTVLYTQYASANLLPYTPKRASDFDDFPINESKLSYPVETGEQLLYVLERHALPLPIPGSPAASLYKKMKDVLREIVDDEMTDLEKVRAIHDFLVMEVVYDGALLNLVDEGASPEVIATYDGFYLEGVFNNKKAVCDGISKAFAALANMEGIRCVTVEGYAADNPDGLGHAWNKVYLDGDWYIVDATSDGTVVGESYEVLSYEFFLIDEASYSTRYVAKNRQNIVCEKKYDHYAENGFTVSGVFYDFVIVSLSELTQLVSYLDSFQEPFISLECRIDFAIGESLTDELQEAINASFADGRYGYLGGDGGIYTLIKRAS